MGWTYNTPDGVPNNGPHITVICILFTVASFIMLSLRMYVRACMIKTVGAGMYIHLPNFFNMA